MIAAAPATATHTGSTPSQRAEGEPGEREREHDERRPWQRAAPACAGAPAARGRSSSVAKKRDSTSHSTRHHRERRQRHQPGERENESPLAAKATGS